MAGVICHLNSSPLQRVSTVLAARASDTQTEFQRLSVHRLYCFNRALPAWQRFCRR
jgi:hypothetical protein